MQRRITFLLLSGLLTGFSVTQGQTDPGTVHLTHQWTFDDGTANDGVAINPVHGTLMGGATIENNALKLSSEGDYMSFSGTDIAINTYTAVTQELWFKSVAGANTGYTMLSYFGTVNQTMGYNYISTSAARGDDKSWTCITDGTYDSEIGAGAPEYDDGQLHHMVSVVSTDSVLLYIDGVLADKTVNTIPISSVSNAHAYLGKSDYSNDPTWIGSISKYSIYNKKLTGDEVKFLYQAGAEQSPMITASVSAIAFDEYISSASFSVSGYNLEDVITIIAPEGITLSETELAADARNVQLDISYDGTTAIDSVIVLLSGAEKVELSVKTYTNDCYTPFYQGLTNLNSDPYVHAIDHYTGWGNRFINTDPAYVYCGASSGNVRGTNAGSLDIELTGLLETNTQYRVRAKVYAMGGSFQVGVLGWSSAQGDFIHPVRTTGSWQDVDFVFTTGASLGPEQRVFFNNYGLSGTSGYIDNWEVFAVPKVYTSVEALDFITPSSKTINVRAVSLNEDVTITAPTGISVSQSTLAADYNDEITVTFDGNESTAGYIYFTSDTITDSLFVSASVAPVFIASADVIGVDEINDSTAFSISGYNLSHDATLTAPAGVTLSTYTLPANVYDSVISVAYDGAGNSSGDISITSGSYTFELPLKANRNDACFTPLYTGRENLIDDPTCNFLYTDGSGNRSINSDLDYVYCGARSGKITGGSLNRPLTGVLQPNTKYHMRAKVYKKSLVRGDNMGLVTYTLDLDSAANPEVYNRIKTAMDSACYYFNKYTPFIENVYVYYNSGIPTAQASYHGSIGFGPDSRYQWVGTAMHEMAHYFGSGTAAEWQNTMVNGRWTGSAGNAMISEITDGATTVVSGDNNNAPQHYWPYGVNQKEEITELGSQVVQEQALADVARLVKAMLVDDCQLPTNNSSVGVGVYGWKSGEEDIYKPVTVSNSWQEIDYTFTTGNNMAANQGVFFNEGEGYIDNWELYALSNDVTLSGIIVEAGNTDTVLSVSGNDLVLELAHGITEVNVTANPADTNATVTGGGNIDVSLSDTTLVNITVTSESELVTETYTLKLIADGLVNITNVNTETITVYPTLTSGELTIDFGPVAGVFEVYTITGVKVMEHRTPVNKQSITIESKGIYLVNLLVGNMQRTVKVVVN